MNIQSISELNTADETLSSNILKLKDIDAYIEVSYKSGKDTYVSKKMSLSTLMTSIYTELLNLSNYSNWLSNKADTICGNYVPLSGNAKIYGKITIQPQIVNDNTDIFNVYGKYSHKGNVDVSPISTTRPVVKVTNGLLICAGADIDGCALTARWS